MNNSPKLTDEQLLIEIKRRLDENAAKLLEEKKLTTELNAVNDKLIASEKLKSNFLSNIRNEINNPIASILELSKNIAQGDISQEMMSSFAKLIYSEAFDLDFQLRNIFLSAEVEAGESPLMVISVKIQQLLGNIIQQFNHRTEKKGITLEWVNTIDENQIFKTDSEKLHLIISNLIANAIQFNHEYGKIKIESDIIDNVLNIKVSDTGIGINQEEQDKIYDRFYQIESGSIKTYGGHGLGLSITKALVDILEGTISLKSQLGEGSEFLIQLPNLESESLDDDTFSSDGNDFLFDNDEDDMLF
jgi:signal transduction histidine kinase